MNNLAGSNFDINFPVGYKPSFMSDNNLKLNTLPSVLNNSLTLAQGYGYPDANYAEAIKNINRPFNGLDVADWKAGEWLTAGQMGLSAGMGLANLALQFKAYNDNKKTANLQRQALSQQMAQNAESWNRYKNAANSVTSSYNK